MLLHTQSGMYNMHKARRLEEEVDGERARNVARSFQLPIGTPSIVLSPVAPQCFSDDLCTDHTEAIEQESSLSYGNP